MLAVTRGAVNFCAIFSRLRREVHSGVVDTDSTPDVHIITPLDVIFSEHRSYNSHIPFSTMDVSCLKDFYGRVAKWHSENEGDAMMYIFSADQVEPYVRLFELAVVIAFAATAIFSSKRCWFCLC